MGKKVTIQDIADALGISRNTVSKAINNTDGLADATRERILQKATEMGYKQFSYVTAMRKAAAESVHAPGDLRGKIALLTGDTLDNSHFATLMLDKFHREIAQIGYTMETYLVSEREFKTLSLPMAFRREQVHSVLCVEMFDWNYCQMLCQLGLPILFVDGPAKLGGRSLPADQLYMNNTDELTRLMEMLISHGKTRIGFVGDHTRCQSFYERYLAYHTAMSMASLPMESKFSLLTLNPAEILQRLSQLDRLPDVFVCANDFVAADVIYSLGLMGVRVPEDVLVSGFDDSPESRRLRPSLTTVHIHTQTMANEALRLLTSRFQAPSLDYRCTYTETDLILRDSTPLD